MEWQPIDTAPHGEELLFGVMVQDIWRVWVCYDEFNSGEFGCDGEFGDPPTHWMPLPEPPK